MLWAIKIKHPGGFPQHYETWHDADTGQYYLTSVQIPNYLDGRREKSLRFQGPMKITKQGEKNIVLRNILSHWLGRRKHLKWAASGPQAAS